MLRLGLPAKLNDFPGRSNLLVFSVFFQLLFKLACSTFLVESKKQLLHTVKSALWRQSSRRNIWSHLGLHSAAFIPHCRPCSLHLSVECRRQKSSPQRYPRPSSWKLWTDYPGRGSWSTGGLKIGNQLTWERDWCHHHGRAGKVNAVTLAFHMGTGSSLSPPLLIQLLASGLAKADKKGSSLLVLATHVGDLEEAPASAYCSLL